MAEVGTGTTITLAGAPAGFLAEVLSIEHTGAERPVIDVTHLGSTNAREKTPGNLVDWGSIDVEILLDPSLLPPMKIAAGSTAIAFPDGSTWTWTAGFATTYGTTVPLEDRITATMSIALASDLAITP